MPGAASRSSHRARDIPAHFEQTWFYPKNNSAAAMLQYVHGRFIRANFARFMICLCRAGRDVARVLTAVPHALRLWHTQRTEARVSCPRFLKRKQTNHVESHRTTAFLLCDQSDHHRMKYISREPARTVAELTKRPRASTRNTAQDTKQFFRNNFSPGGF